MASSSLAHPPPPESSSPSGIPSGVEGPVQIVSVAADGATFSLHEARLQFVLRQVPPGMRVAVVSVVGAFRTGKSFLLDVLLRYLRWCEANPGGACG